MWKLNDFLDDVELDPTIFKHLVSTKRSRFESDTLET